MTPHRRITGHIRYTSKKTQLLDRDRGREDFAFTRHADGAVTLSAHCEIDEPAPSVMRDILYALDARGRPMDCSLRLSLGGAFLGSGWICFDHALGYVECESVGPTIGRVSQRLAIPEGLAGFGAHPIAGDGYLTRCMDTAQGPHARTIAVLLPSPDHRGATPPLLAQVNINLAYLGDEPRSVAAGTFPCHHFRFQGEGVAGGNEHPPYDLWVTADADSIFVCGGVGGTMQTWYELTRLER